jgi:hypothetical protein
MERDNVDRISQNRHGQGTERNRTIDRSIASSRCQRSSRVLPHILGSELPVCRGGYDAPISCRLHSRLTSLPYFHLLSHRLKIPLYLEGFSTSLKLFLRLLPRRKVPAVRSRTSGTPQKWLH